ncbi:MAG TPA: GPW/gp25 family protein [Blastocatellia bacterium]|nr:GPW/gp25 family protein [Blastocatellia bacterium]
MNNHRYRAWRFLHPDLDMPEDWAGLSFSPTGGIEMVEERESVRQAVLLLLSTRTGERVMRPDYGCDLHKLVFSPNDDTTAGLAMHYVRQAIERWEPRIVIERLDAGRDEEYPERLNILLEYRMNSSNSRDSLMFSVNMTGEVA